MSNKLSDIDVQFISLVKKVAPGGAIATVLSNVYTLSDNAA